MDEEVFQKSLRKFLKQVGVTSQQEIEKALQEANDSGKLESNEVNVNMTLTIPEIDLRHEVDGELTLQDK